MSFILPGGLGQISASVLSAFGTTNIAGPITLSNNNRTITTNATNAGYIGGSAGRSSGQLYFEGKFTTIHTPATNADCSIGVVNGSWTASAAFSSGDSTVGATVNGIAVGAQTSITWNGIDQGGPGTPFGVVPANNDVIGVAVNFNISGNIGVWFRLNGNWLNLGSPTPTFPSTQPDATWSPTPTMLWVAASLDQSSSMTLNVGNAAFANAPPSGYSAWG